MGRFGKREVTGIIEFLEKQLDAVPRIEKLEKMKLRSKIRQQEYWLMAAENPKPHKILDKLEGRLTDLFMLYPHGFREELVELLDMEISKLAKNAPS